MLEPRHLENAQVSQQNVFDDSEVLYRRYIKNQTYPENEFFTEIKTKDFVEGISVNRKSLCRFPEDVLWSDSKDDQENCQYTYKGGSVIQTTVGDLKCDKNTTGVRVYCKHTLKKCNVSHCDILFDPPLELATSSEKQKARDVKLFLASIFAPV